VDAARARLSIIGARSVEHLIEALEGDNNRIRARAMPLLALIQDPRGREPLIAMLLDRHAGMRQTAARCLARFPSPDVVAALNRTLKRERDPRVRIAAVHSLVELYSAGQEGAIRLLLPMLVEADEPTENRLAAFALLRVLRPGHRRSILTRLQQDQDEAIRIGALELERDDGCEDSDGRGIPELLQELGASDYPTWNEAVRRLGSCGATVVEPVIEEMCARAHDPEYCARAGMVLKSLGPRRGRPIADALDRVDEPLPLQVIVEVIGALGEKSLIYRLQDLIERLEADSRQPMDGDRFDPVQRVRAKAHLELAKIGSRVAIGDLRGAIENPEHRLELEMLAAVELIGKREELGPLLRAYGREDTYVRERIGRVVRAIMRRERIRRNNRMFRALSASQRAALTKILPSAPPRASMRGAKEGPAIRP
jgi:HEAT repeat protein